MCRVEINYLNKPKKYVFYSSDEAGKRDHCIFIFIFCHLLEDMFSPRLLQKRAMREETTNTFLSCWVYGTFGLQSYNKLVGANESEAGQNASFLKLSTVDATLKTYEKQM